MERFKIKPKSTLRTETAKTIHALMITLTIMIFVLGAAFLLLTNENSQKGYALEQEKRKNEQLQSENSNINTKITQITSALKVEEREEIKNMTEPEAKIFVTPEDNMVE